MFAASVHAADEYSFNGKDSNIASHHVISDTLEDADKNDFRHHIITVLNDKNKKPLQQNYGNYKIVSFQKPEYIIQTSDENDEEGFEDFHDFNDEDMIMQQKQNKYKRRRRTTPRHRRTTRWHRRTTTIPTTWEPYTTTTRRTTSEPYTTETTQRTTQ